MKKILALTLALVMIFALACSSMAFAEETHKVGIAMPTKSLERWNRDGAYLEEQFKALGYEVELVYSDNDAVQQNNDIANMIADGVEVLIIAAIDSDTLSSVQHDDVVKFLLYRILERDLVRPAEAVVVSVPEKADRHVGMAFHEVLHCLLSPVGAAVIYHDHLIYVSHDLFIERPKNADDLFFAVICRYKEQNTRSFHLLLLSSYMQS